MSVERIVDTEDFLKEGPVQSVRINRLMTDGVAETPHGGHFTECVPDYPRDEQFQKAYAASAKTPEAWAEWKAKYLDCGDHAEYRKVLERSGVIDRLQP
jgi:glutaconate CoA-transferase subunit A